MATNVEQSADTSKATSRPWAITYRQSNVVITDERRVVAQVYGETATETKAHAHRIIERVNGWEALVAERDIAEKFHAVAVAERNLAQREAATLRAERDALRDALAKVSLMRGDTTSSASEKVAAAGRIAHSALEASRPPCGRCDAAAPACDWHNTSSIVREWLCDACAKAARAALGKGAGA